MAGTGIDRLVRVAPWPLLVIGIGGIVGILWDTAHIPGYIFGVELSWMGRAAHIPWAMVSVGLWSSLTHCFVDGLL